MSDYFSPDHHPPSLLVNDSSILLLDLDEPLQESHKVPKTPSICSSALATASLLDCPFGPFPSHDEAIQAVNEWSTSHHFHLIKFDKRHRKDGHSQTKLRCQGPRLPPKRMKVASFYPTQPNTRLKRRKVIHKMPKCPFVVDVYRRKKENDWIVRVKDTKHQHNHPLDDTTKGVGVNTEEEEEVLGTDDEIPGYDINVDDVPVSLYDTMPLGPFPDTEYGAKVLNDWSKLHGFNLLQGMKHYDNFKTLRHHSTTFYCGYGPENESKCPWKIRLVKLGGDEERQENPTPQEWYVIKRNLRHSHPLSSRAIEYAQKFYPPLPSQGLNNVPRYYSPLNAIVYDETFPHGPFSDADHAFREVVNWCVKHGFLAAKGNRATRKTKTDAGHYLTDVRCSCFSKKNAPTSSSLKTGCPWRVQILRERNESKWFVYVAEAQHNHYPGWNQIIPPELLQKPLIPDYLLTTCNSVGRPRLHPKPMLGEFDRQRPRENEVALQGESPNDKMKEWMETLINIKIQPLVEHIVELENHVDRLLQERLQQRRQREDDISVVFEDRALTELDASSLDDT